MNSGYPFLNVFYASSPCAAASPSPTFDTPLPTADGFTVNVTNYDALYTWTPTVDAGSVSAGTASGSTLPLTVTGLAAGASATVTMTTSRSGYTNGSATILTFTPICAPSGFTFAGWTSKNTPRGSGTPQSDAVVIKPGDPLPQEWLETTTSPVNRLELYAIWQYMG